MASGRFVPAEDIADAITRCQRPSGSAKRQLLQAAIFRRTVWAPPQQGRRKAQPRASVEVAKPDFTHGLRWDGAPRRYLVMLPAGRDRRLRRSCAPEEAHDGCGEALGHSSS